MGQRRIIKDDIKYYYIDECLFHMVDCIVSNKEIPYYDIGELKLCKVYNWFSVGGLIHYILSLHQASKILRIFDNFTLLDLFLPELSALKYIPQEKHFSKNAFDHTLRVLDNVPIDDMELRWAALLHDIGKYTTYKCNKNFIGHEKVGAEESRYVLNKFGIINVDFICSIIKNHMLPLDYQRKPDWKEDTVVKHTKEIGFEIILKTVELAYYDKKSEQTKEVYLDSLLKLRNLIIKLHEGEKNG